MKKLLLVILLTIISYASNLPTNSIVKIHTSASIFDYKHPWQTSKIYRYVGSGSQNYKCYQVIKKYFSIKKLTLSFVDTY
jgi:glycosylphosphatidylinositol transamidase (GPIT) subunit GPI8